MSGSLKIIFAGTPEFAAITLDALLQSGHAICAVYTQPDRPSGRGRKVLPGAVKKLALGFGVPVFQPTSLKDRKVHDQLHGLNADIMVVVAYGLLLPPQVLTIPRLGCVNVHASLLPRWRGAAPIQRAILAGDVETGITIMQMNAGLDSGDILQSASCDIRENDTAGSLHDRLAHLGATTLLSTLPQIANNAVMRMAQDERLACYAPKIDKAEAYIDWTQSAADLDRAVRAYNPWPVAYTIFDNDERLRILQAECFAVREYQSQGMAPGTVVHTDSDGIDVVTGQGILRLLRIQPAGGRVMPARDFLNAYPVRKGTVLGQAR